MQNKKFLKDLSGSAIQIAITQFANLLIFYLISKYVSKELFGFYNWSTALVSTIITALSLGMDLVYVRRVAANVKRHETISIHFFHVLFFNIALIIGASCLVFIVPNLLDFNLLFLLILINQAVFTFGNSIKFSLNGLEQYNVLAKIALITGTTRIISILSLLFLGSFTMTTIMVTFIANYLFEFLISYLYAGQALKYYIKPQFIAKEYKALIKESLPQLGTVLFDSAIARIDWILMGIIATAVQTAEYTFSFKIFEVSKMPYLVIAPILLTRFSKIFKIEKQLSDVEKKSLDNLYKVELFIAVLIPLIAISIWSDFFDLITDGKYGEVNFITYTILAICIPLHYSTNFLWTLAFTQNQLKMIFVVTAITSSLNIILNIILIPIWGAEGAAISFLISTTCQLILYFRLTKQTSYKFKTFYLFKALLIGVAAILITYWLDLHWIVKGIINLTLYLGFMFGFKFISLKTIKTAFI